MKTTREGLPEIPAERFSRHDPASARRFREMVLTYYAGHGRDLAWRRTTDPYRILVSEIMLQQTQVERVSLRFPAFIACRGTPARRPCSLAGDGIQPAGDLPAALRPAGC